MVKCMTSDYLKTQKFTLEIVQSHWQILDIYEHKNKLVPGFTSKYNVDKLVYYDSTNEVMSAIEREKQIKGWTRKKKIKLIDYFNPDWTDLYSEIIE